ncbi:MAG: group II intron reverse transcriptase/maturase, partial [Pseudonocardiaceae bacterium]
MTTSKSYEISKQEVWEAYQDVKANDGAAGVDGESIAEFERKLKGNLYKLWNRMSSGSYFPPAVRQVEIPKSDGRGVRVLGIPTVTDRIAQTVVKRYVEPALELEFHADSYAYRPGRSAVQAVGVCRDRCWKSDWVIDLDIRSFFDTVEHTRMMKALRCHTNLPWIHLYIERWLVAPLEQRDGTRIERKRGTPQGSVISPLLGNLYLHYAFDKWMRWQYPSVRFERYADDIVVHCESKEQAEQVLVRITERFAECELEVNEEKTKIVYCKDDRRRGRHEHERFDFLGYTFGPRQCKGRGRSAYFVGFNPAISDAAKLKISRCIRRWHLNRRVGSTLAGIAHAINAEIRGWYNYYGCYFPSELYPLLQRINEHLARWAQRKYKRLQGYSKRAWRFLGGVATREPNLFAH